MPHGMVLRCDMLLLVGGHIKNFLSKDYSMKRMLLISTFLIGICFNQCLAWTIVGIKNELNEDVCVQLMKEKTSVLSLDKVFPHMQ